MIEATVSATSMTLSVDEKLTAGRVGLVCSFSFSDEWDGLTKIAVFEGAEAVTVPITDDQATVPPEVFAGAAGSRLRISVVGKSTDGTEVIPTIWASAGRIESSGADEEYSESTWEPTESLAAQIQSMAANAESIAQSVRADADAGKFNGATGAQGPKGDTGAAGEKGEKGDTGTFTDVTASVDDTTGTPAVEVTYDGDTVDFAFTGLKGASGGGSGSVDSVNGQTGTVVLDAEDVGARADTWMPSASDVGARADDWMPSADDVGAVPTTRTVCGKALSADITLSASNVGARSSSWMPTAAQVGARADTWLPSETEVVTDITDIRSGAALGATALQSVPSTYRTAAEQDEIHDSTKQDVISDLETIRSGAEAGATALQGSYGSTLPTTGTTGEVFFKI